MAARSSIRRRTPRPVTAETLARAAADYVARYDSSSAQLREVLQRRIRRAEHAGATVPPDATQIIDALLERYARAGILDDAAYARRRTERCQKRSARRSRCSSSHMRASLL